MWAWWLTPFAQLSTLSLLLVHHHHHRRRRRRRRRRPSSSSSSSPWKPLFCCLAFCHALVPLRVLRWTSRCFCAGLFRLLERREGNEHLHALADRDHEVTKTRCVIFGWWHGWGRRYFIWTTLYPRRFCNCAAKTTGLVDALGLVSQWRESGYEADAAKYSMWQKNAFADPPIKSNSSRVVNRFSSSLDNNFMFLWNYTHSKWI